MDSELLQAALVGLAHRRAEIDQKIAQVHAMLGNGAAGRTSPVTPTPKKHTMSIAGRKRIAAAQRKRWAAVKRAQTAQKRPSVRRKAAVAKEALRKITVKPKKTAPKKHRYRKLRQNARLRRLWCRKRPSGPSR